MAPVETGPPAPDRPGVIAPPPLVFAAFFAVGWAVDRAFHASLFDAGAWTWIGGASIATGAALALWTVALFRRARTAIEPWRPTTAIITGGPFRFSRNPTYISVALMHAGAAVVLDLPWALAMLLPAMAAIDVGVVRREERYLERKFGESYRRYRQSVRRWL